MPIMSMPFYSTFQIIKNSRQIYLQTLKGIRFLLFKQVGSDTKNKKIKIKIKREKHFYERKKKVVLYLYGG